MKQVAGISRKMSASRYRVRRTSCGGRQGVMGRGVRGRLLHCAGFSCRGLQQGRGYMRRWESPG